jgi:hypothetical protein
VIRWLFAARPAGPGDIVVARAAVHRRSWTRASRTMSQELLKKLARHQLASTASAGEGKHAWIIIPVLLGGRRLCIGCMARSTQSTTTTGTQRQRRRRIGVGDGRPMHAQKQKACMQNNRLRECIRSLSLIYPSSWGWAAEMHGHGNPYVTSAS